MSDNRQNMSLGLFQPADVGVTTDGNNFLTKLRRLDQPLFISSNCEGDSTLLYSGSSQVDLSAATKSFSGMVLPCPLDSLGDAAFCQTHQLRYPYVGGSMAKGISSVAMVQELGRAGMLGFFGAAGLSMELVEVAIKDLSQSNIPFGINLIHSPAEPKLENALVELYLRHEVRLIEASAFLSLTLPIIRYRTHGIYRNDAGAVVAPNRVIAKISREEVAARFFAPPPDKYLQQLVASGDLTPEQAAMATEIPVAQDVTVEADSGGHTDNRPALSLFPTILAQKEQFQQQYNYREKLRVGLGGGIATPTSAAAAFAMGAAYLVTGSVNQACVESGTGDEVRKL
ncbi:MAG: 2-nitropropane dioxygenase, partial [Desulfuromonadales bacterium]|nr:2-nitropropane dioxygenase [Desulfuromonadales bacterium]